TSSAVTTTHILGTLAFAAQNNGQPGPRIPDHDNLGIAARGELFGRLDSFPLEQLRADPLCDDALEVGNALRLDALPLRLLLLFLKHELHLLRLMLAAQLLLNRPPDHR